MIKRPWLVARLSAGVLVVLLSGVGLAEIPDHPIITEMYSDPAGPNDGPVGREASNPHQEFLEIYLPPCAALNLALDCNQMNLTFYEVEGDHSSSGLGLVNYRLDLPAFCLLDDPQACPPGTIPRPPSGVVVLGWVDYLGNPPSGLAGTPGTRIGLVNGGITSTSDYVFVAINGHQFDGTTNFPVLTAESLIDLPNEAGSGIFQNGSGTYLLVDRDSPGYLELCDDQHVADCAAGAAPVLPNNLVGLSSVALLDGYAGNDDPDFDVELQPLDVCDDDPVDCVDLQTVLPAGGAFSLLVPQVPEQANSGLNPGQANGYVRDFVDVPKTTESAVVNDDPIEDALNAYRHVRNNGPFFATPGRAPLTSSAPELSVAVDSEQVFEVLSRTTGRPGLLSANVGGDFGIEISASGGMSSDPAVATFTAGLADTAVGGRTLGFPSVAVTPADNAAHGASASAVVTVNAVNSSGADPAVLSPVHEVSVLATVLDPTTGLDAGGLPFETTVFVAIQGVVADPGVANEFLQTSLGQVLAAQPDITVLETLEHGVLLLNPATDISNPLVIQPLIKEFPDQGEECTTWLNPAGALGTLDLAQTVLQSAEVQSGATTYDESLAVNIDCGLGPVSTVKAIKINHPDTETFGSQFNPSELVHFVAPTGFAGNPRSGLTNATSSRTFEIVIVDTAVTPQGPLESGASDDFGLVIEVQDTEPGSQFVDGQFVFLSFSGGLQGADIDTLAVPPGNLLANLIYLDLDNLHDVLGIRSTEQIFIIDGSGGGELDVIEAFTLASIDLNPCPADLSGDNTVDASDLAQVLGAWGPNPGHPADLNGDGIVDASDLAMVLGSWGACS